MNILVLNGSPKGEYSITLQTVRYLEKLNPEDTFTVLHVGQRIKALEKIPSEDSLQNGNWLCTCGKVHASYVTSCSCGATKRIVLENKSH